MSTPQRSSSRFARLLPASLSFFAAASCAPAAQSIPSTAPLIAVVAPRSESDFVGILVDGQTQRGQWYCSSAPAPQTFEVMFGDAVARPVRAVGIVADNLGPDGVGAVRVRVQTGHGVTAVGETYRAVPRGHGGRLQLITLPRIVNGDHVVLTFERRSRYATALCLGEIALFGEDLPADTYRIEARPLPEASSSSPPASSQPLTAPPMVPTSPPEDAASDDASTPPTS